ncbi:MAG: ABC transporter ATP-binding protein [Bacillota bacterium]
MGVGEKPKDLGKAMGKLFKHSGSYVKYIIMACVLAIAGVVLQLIGPNRLSEVANLITEGLFTSLDMTAIVSLCTLIACLYALSFVFNFCQTIIMATVTQKIARSLRDKLSRKINRLPLKYFDKRSYGDVLSRVTNDVDTIGNAMNMSFSSAVSAITLFLGTIVMMFVTNWILALVAIGSSIIGFSLVGVIIGNSQKYFIRQQRELGTLNGHIEEMYAGHKVVRVSNGEEKAKVIFAKTNNKLYRSAWKSQFMSGLMQPLMQFIGNFGYVMVCVVGGILALDGTISMGDIVAFMIYVRLFSQPLGQIAQAFTNVQSAGAASERVFEFLEEPELEDEGHKTTVLDIQNVHGDVEFCNVNFGYLPEKTIINDFSAKALAGQKVAIVGPTGAGKTTMVNLLMRFYEVNSGDIKIDGISIKDITRENVHGAFCMVLQDTWLFEGTLRDNIIYSKKGATDADLERACKAVGLHHFIKTLPKGYDTIMNEAASLSAGQKQLVTIARAMIEDAPLLILDEATSSVDTRTEVLIQQAMDKLTEGRTSFVIAHRLSTIKNADLILVMKDGDIIESGNHDALMTKGGFYSELYNSQFETVE